MSDIYESPDEVTQEMLDDYKQITGIELSINDIGREEVVRFKTFALTISAKLAKMQQIEDSFFPASSTEEGLVRHLAAKQLPDRAQPQRSNGVLQFTANLANKLLPIGTQVKKLLDGKIYQTTVAVTPLGVGTVNVNAESVDTGQDQNIEVENGVQFELVAAVEGYDAEVISNSQFRDGRNLETPAEMLQRIQTHDRRTDTGGNLAAYERFAREASPQVVTARALDEPRGPGTVDIIITSGTTDIRQAIENNEAVTRLPSAALVAEVDTFVKTKNPTTDDLETNAPTEEVFNVTVTYDLFDESLRSLVDSDIDKEAKIFILEALPKDVLHPTELERLIDSRVGHLITARRVADFTGGVSFTVPDDKLETPGVITKGPFP